MEVKIVNGGVFEDERGKLFHVNDFDFSEVKRFYVIEHPDKQIIRAWQGHQFERKWFYVVSGSFCVAWVKVDNWDLPNLTTKAEYVILNANESRIITVPSGYANGLKALEPNSKIIVYSDMLLEQSVNERIKYPKDYWLDWDTI